MKSLFRISAIILLGISAGCMRQPVGNVTVINPRCEYMEGALTVKKTPRFSWELASGLPDQRQTAWQIIVSDDPVKAEKGKGNIWNSRKRKGDESFGIRMEGNRLTSFREYYWKVRIWDGSGKVSGWSKTGHFFTGAFSKDDWKASWIGDKPEKPLEYPLLYKHIGYLSSYTDNSNEEKWVQIDLGDVKEFDKIRLYPSFNNIENIRDYYFPSSWRIGISNDGEAWDKIAEKSGAAPGGKPVQVSPGVMKGRFIRVTATELKRYGHRVYDYEDQGDPSKMYAFSLAEIEVSAGGTVISGGAKVSCKDALVKIDREDGYDPDMLTDGITGTPPHPDRRPIPPSPLLRKSFNLREKPSQALAFVSALGDYELTINGQKPANNVLAPEWTDYHKRVQYQVYDLTGFLDAGENVAGVQLADGWYAGMLGPTRWSEYFPKRGAYGLDRRLFFQMEVNYPDGSSQTFVSDSTWKIFRDGPVRMADNFLGETYDFRREISGWDTPGYDATDWDTVISDNTINVNLVPQVNQPVKVLEMLPAKSVTRTKEGYALFDAGENIAGWCRIRLKGKAGDRIILRHGEILDDSGELYTDNLGAAIQTDTVILGSTGETEYEPRFTYHGFRYVEVRGLEEFPDKDILEALVVASDQPRTGDFECSNPMLNQLYKNINRSHISNMIGVPTDCPQRDERCGWMGDVFIFAQTAMFNRDMAAFFSKWMIDILDAQSARGTFPDIAPHPFAFEKHFTNAPGWADAAIKLPWLMFRNYGDTEIIADHFEAYERYIANIVKTNPDLIWKHGLGLNYGDWLNGNTLNAAGFPRTGAQIPSTVFSTIMFYNSVNTLSMMAEITGNHDKAGYYSRLAGDIKKAFSEHFITSDGKIEGDSQSCYAMALYYGIYPPELEKTFEKRMIDKFIPYAGRMNTGFHSTLCLMKELIKRGYYKKAYELLETSEFPSWGYSISQGATSVWERWDGYVKGRGFQGAGMNSFNHYAFGAIGEWMYENILGIQPDPASAGYRHFFLKPVPGGTLTRASGSYNSISGLIKAGWKKEDGRFTYDFTIPPNTTATVFIPSASKETILINGKKPSGQLLEKSMLKEGHTVLEMTPGNWTVSSEISGI